MHAATPERQRGGPAGLGGNRDSRLSTMMATVTVRLGITNQERRRPSASESATKGNPEPAYNKKAPS